MEDKEHDLYKQHGEILFSKEQIPRSDPEYVNKSISCRNFLFTLVEKKSFEKLCNLIKDMNI